MSWAKTDLMPAYGENYRRGYVGFTFNDSSFLSKGIAYFTRWDRKKEGSVPCIPVSHCLIVADSASCYEATWPKVAKNPIGHYFEDPHTHIVFRKPRQWSPLLADCMAMVAQERIGQGYGSSLIIGHALTNTLLGHGLNFITFGWSRKILLRMFEEKDKAICSEYVAWVMKRQPEFVNVPLWNVPEYGITPQMLFRNDDLFEPWSNEEN